MPRIKKIKFQDDGTYQPDTTFTGYITLDLQYDARDSYFFFDEKDLFENIHTLKKEDYHRGSFYQCEKARDAIKIVENLIASTYLREVRKMLFIELQADIPRVAETKSFTHSYSSKINNSEIRIGYGKALELINPRNGEKIIVRADDKWKRKGSLHDMTDRYHFVEHSDEREVVLRNAVSTIRNVGQNIYEMFIKGVNDGDLGGVLERQLNGFLLSEGK